MTTGPTTGRLSTTEAARRALDLAEAMASRKPSEPESSVSITRNAKGAAQFEVVVRGTIAHDCEAMARTIYDQLVLTYPYPETNGGTAA